MAVAIRMEKNVTVSQVLDEKVLAQQPVTPQSEGGATPDSGCVISVTELDNVQSVCYNACFENIHLSQHN